MTPTPSLNPMPSSSTTHLSTTASQEPGRGSLNRYGHLLREHWMQTNPEQVTALMDPEAFFAVAGREADTRIQELETAIAGSDLPGETFTEKFARLQQAHRAATEQVMAEMLQMPLDETTSH